MAKQFKETIEVTQTNAGAAPSPLPGGASSRSTGGFLRLSFAVRHEGEQPSDMEPKSTKAILAVLAFTVSAGAGSEPTLTMLARQVVGVNACHYQTGVGTLISMRLFWRSE
jgi:hypothetical protein